MSLDKFMFHVQRYEVDLLSEFFDCCCHKFSQVSRGKIETEILLHLTCCLYERIMQLFASSFVLTNVHSIFLIVSFASIKHELSILFY